MYKHYIILSSSYSKGERIALDYVDASKVQVGAIRDFVSKIKQECGEDIAISIHCVESPRKDWNGVSEADAFFERVRLVETQEEFIREIKNDRILTGEDVAKYILSEVADCTHLKLQKLLYLCYADYLCETKGEKLFNDVIYAYTYGPVVKSVYDRYRGSKYEILECDETGGFEIIPERKYKLSARSRIIFSENGINKISSILKTLERYKGYSSGQLVSITHRSNSPWSHSDSRHINQVISDENILRYHYNETI